MGAAWYGQLLGRLMTRLRRRCVHIVVDIGYD